MCGYADVGILLCGQSLPGFDGGGRADSVSWPGGGVKRVRLNRKTPAHFVGHGFWEVQSRPRVWKTENVGASRF